MVKLAIVMVIIGILSVIISIKLFSDAQITSIEPDSLDLCLDAVSADIFDHEH